MAICSLGYDSRTIIFLKIRPFEALTFHIWQRWTEGKTDRQTERVCVCMWMCVCWTYATVLCDAISKPITVGAGSAECDMWFVISASNWDRDVLPWWEHDCKILFPPPQNNKITHSLYLFTHTIAACLPLKRHYNARMWWSAEVSGPGLYFVLFRHEITLFWILKIYMTTIMPHDWSSLEQRGAGMYNSWHD